MKSIVVALAFLAVVAADNAHDHVHKKVCVKGSNADCSELKDAAKTILQNIRESRTGELETDVPKFLDHLKELFALTAKYDCKIDVCKCVDDKLECGHITDKIRAPIAKLELPECIATSEKAKELMDKFKQAVEAGDKEAISQTIGELNEALKKAFAEDDKPKAECLKKTVLGLKGLVKAKLHTYDIQKTCDFCGEPAVVGPALLGNTN